ncbi:MAG: STAS domain-containing protein [Solirubrobacteraceae bacterium]
MRPDDLLRIERRDHGPVAVLALHGELDIATAGLLAQALPQAVRDGRRRLLVDLRGVRLMDSVGVRALVHARRRMSNRDGTAAFVCTEEPIGRTVRQMGLYDALGFTQDYAGALAQLAAAH